MKYGNCLLGVLFLFWRERKNNPELVCKPMPYSIIPHLMVKTTNGIYHYKVKKEILPWPFCYFLYQGSYETIGEKK